MSASCPECGSELPPEAKFCVNCGHQLAAAAAPADPARARLEQYIPKELLAKLEAAGSGPNVPGGMGERRVVTMLFCDVTGSTAAAENLDPEDWAEIMNGAFEHLITPVYRYEGTLARLMGDAILAFFGASIAHEDDPNRAVLAGLDISRSIIPYRQQVQQEWGVDFQVRVGINTGLVVVGEVGSDLRVEYTALGDAINVAARMEQAATPGTVLISADTHRLVAPLFDFDDQGLIDVKGKSEPVGAYRVLGPKAAPGRLRGIEGLSAPLIGRDKQTETLRQSLTQLSEGRGGIVSIIGEAGLGKSRLLEETRGDQYEGLAEKINWMDARCVSYDTSRPYGVFAQQLRNTFHVAEIDPSGTVSGKIRNGLEGHSGEELETIVSAVESLIAPGNPSNNGSSNGRLDGETVKRRMFGAVLSIWRQISSPTAIVCDDLHWADPGSAELLIHLFQLVERAPILFICLFRPERQSPAWQVRQSAETDYPHRYSEISLEALSDEDSDTLFGNLLNISDSPTGLRELIHAKTEGNPLFVEEFTRTLIDMGAVARDENGMRWVAGAKVEDIPIPENLQALLTSRIDRLDENAKRALQVGSVIGRSFYHRVIEFICGSDISIDEELSALQRAELIREASRVPELEYSFQHDLTRDAAYTSILLRQRREFHRGVGEALENLFSGRLAEQAHRLAHHFYEAGDGQRALKYSMMAGDSAAGMYAHEEAAGHYTRAVEAVGRVEPTDEEFIGAYAARGRTLELCGEFEQALENYRQLQTLAEELGNRALELAALIPQATVYSTSNSMFDGAKGRELSTKGRALAEALEDYGAESKILWNLMLLEYYHGTDRRQAIEFGEQSLAIAREHGLQEQLAFTLNDLARAYFVVGRGEETWAAQKESNGLLRELGNLTMLTDSLITSAGGHYFLGDFQNALESATECLEVSKSIGSPWAQAVSLYVLGAIYLDLGETGKSIQALEDAVPLAQDAGFNPPVTARLRLALFHALAGNADQGMELAQEAMQNGESRQFAMAAVAQTHLSQGDPVAAGAAIAEALRECENGQSDPRAGYAIFQVIEGQTALANQDHQRALTLAERTLAVMAEMGQRVILPDILRIKGEALLGLGDDTGGGAVLEEALAEAESQGARRALWTIQLAMGEAAAARGDQEDRLHLLTQARETVNYIADSCGPDHARENFLSMDPVKRLFAG